jgi:hypothetical protein
MTTSVFVCESCSFLWRKCSNFRGHGLIHFHSVLKNLGFCSVPNLVSQIYFYCLGSATQFVFSLDLSPAPPALVLGPCCVCARSVSPISFLDLVSCPVLSLVPVPSCQPFSVIRAPWFISPSRSHQAGQADLVDLAWAPKRAPVRRCSVSCSGFSQRCPSFPTARESTGIEYCWR